MKTLEEYTSKKKKEILDEIVRMASEDYPKNRKDIHTLIEILQLAKKIEKKNDM